MAFLSFWQLVVVAALVVHRAMLYALPFFAAERDLAPVANALCGLSSDLSLALVAVAVLECLKMPQSANGRTAARLGGAVLGLSTLLLVFVHIRYVEFFGIAFDPVHAYMLETTAGSKEGLENVFASDRVRAASAAVFGLSLVALAVVRLWRRGEIGNVWRTNAKFAAGFLVAAGMFHATTLRLRRIEHVHPELRYNPLFGYYVKAKEIATLPTVPLSSSLLHLRNGFDLSRDWADSSGRYPFWQHSVPSGEALTPLHAQIRGDLSAFFAEEARTKGPWNIVVLMIESMRADALEGFADQGAFHPGLVPNLLNAAASGIRFTETLTTLNMTHHGQTATLCGMFAVPRVAIMTEGPKTHVTCLPDWTASQGYDNWFFYGGDNHFDKQNVFYPFHHVGHIVTRESFPVGTPQGSWGVSDNALLDDAAKRFALAPKPFFATVLTLSNHWPFKLPDDTPPSVDSGLPDREQLRQYDDWAFGNFWEALKRDFPHTILIVVADHGVHFPDEPTPTSNIPYALIRQHFRIPFLIAAPGMPASVAGKALASPVSQADVTPTLLTLLGVKQLENQFLGYDAFSRREPMIIYWEGVFRRLTWSNGLDHDPLQDDDTVGPSSHAHWRALMKSDRLLPPTSVPQPRAKREGETP